MLQLAKAFQVLARAGHIARGTGVNGIGRQGSGDRRLAHGTRTAFTRAAAQVNPNSYYDTMGRPGQRGGERERQLATFARNAVLAAEARTSKPRTLICQYCASRTFFLKLARRCEHPSPEVLQKWTSCGA